MVEVQEVDFSVALAQRCLSPTDTCITLSESEWQGCLKGGRSLLRPYKGVEGKLALAAPMNDGYYLVGSVTLTRCNQVKMAHQNQNLLRVYSQRIIKDLRARCKTLWTWSFGDFTPFAEAIHLQVLSSIARNRPFKLSSLKKSVPATNHDCPSDLSLAEAAEYYFQRGGASFQEKLMEQLRKLSGKTLRVGTTCSGCDICVTVLRQTVEHFNATQDLLSQECMILNY